jgi:uncharacterized protein (DUF427 family)
MASRFRDPRLRELTYEPSERWVRAELGGQRVVDTRRSRLVWEPGRPVPHYAFPRTDVQVEALGDAVTGYEDDSLRDYVSVDWDAVDHWYEEDQEVFAHPADPYSRIDLRPSSRHVRVEIDGTTVADTTRPLLLFETRLPTRYYIPREDVREDLLRPSDSHTLCPYKGVASYYSADTGHGIRDDVVWHYDDPLPEVAAIRGALAFYNERVDIYVDGELQQPPRTQWSKSTEAEA